MSDSTSDVQRPERDPISTDLTPLLTDWPFDPGRLNVRLIAGLDGEPRLQVRLDLGILQMHVEGRPDGQRPFGFDSYLEYHERRLDDIAGSAGDGPGEIRGPVGGYHEDRPGIDHPLFGEDPGTRGTRRGPHDRAEPGDPDEVDEPDHPSHPAVPIGDPIADDNPTDAIDPADPDRPGTFSLSPEECRLLRDEAAQYYHRYVALFVLNDFEAVVRDTSRNLRLIDFCRAYAQSHEDREALMPVRPYVTMMRARAMASQAIRDQTPKAAVLAIDEGLEALKEHYRSIGEPEAFARSAEAQILTELRATLAPKLPMSQRAELRQRLADAIAAENYELAAILRDELRNLPE